MACGLLAFTSTTVSLSPSRFDSKELNNNVLTSQRHSAIVLKKEETMTTLTQRATIYMDPVLHKALRLKSVETSRSISDLVDDAVRDELAEDADDLAVFKTRQKEPTLNFEDFVQELKRNGTI